MSLNSRLSLKLQLGSELRKISKVPSSLSELNQLFLTLYGRQNFIVTYQDEENDFVSITTDSELQEVYKKHLNKPSLKLILKEGQVSQQESVFDRIESLRQSLMQSVSADSLSQPEIIENSQKLDEKSIEIVGENVKNEAKSEVVEEVKKEKSAKQEKKVKKEKSDKKKEKKPKAEKKNQKKEEKSPVVHEHITCDGCNEGPIVGIRYKCSVCYDFDLCESCESALNHLHPMVKIRTPMKTGRSGIWGSSMPNFAASFANCCSSGQEGPNFSFLKNIIGKNIKEMMRKKYRAKANQLLNHPQTVALSGSSVKLGWEIINKGRKAWPAGTKVKLVKGDLVANDFVLNEVAPGAKTLVEIEAKVPNFEGSVVGSWKIVVGHKEFGKIKAKIDVVQDPKIRTLLNMGFNVENAKKALEKTHGDVELAVSQILKS